ncbi:thaumatin-like protein 1 isoform X2 [Impatiens glandulifera]|uniref:thaumatin-like protein 1 isoform X2 n=1 Tax=Impatiens glandulifera TaxID=253017 RepID=UPI001FB10DD7|nr:thaumatin-like protein 1 isoform X2 [Impatiens glandulifera]
MSIYSHIILSLVILLTEKVWAAKFTFINKCDFTVWPGILGIPMLDTTGFELPNESSRSFQAPTGWSGRFWGRTGCNFQSPTPRSCSTGDCGSGEIECNNAGSEPPTTLAEFTLGSGSGQDFYDVSLVDGYNLPMAVDARGGSGACESTGCAVDINKHCPSELRAADGDACKSACGAFGSPEYCCSGEYNSPAVCMPSMYSEMFKNACPRSYSYAYDDESSTFTCTAADYTITFCPSNFTSTPSDKKGTPTSNTPTNGSDSGSGYSDRGSPKLEDVSWFANLATGDSTIACRSSFTLRLVLMVAFVVNYTIIDLFVG